MNGVVEYFNTIESSFRKTKIITICAVTMAAVVSLGAMIYAFTFVSKHTDNIYVLDKGSAYSATVIGAEDVNRGIEAEDHVRRFHEYLFNLSPSREAIQRNIEMATLMCDQSAYDFYMDQQEKGFYSRLIQTNTSQYITVDSVKVNMSVFPYAERTYGRVFVLRESNITSYRFESTGQLVEIGRSKNNPHGLMLEQFAVTRYDRIETRRRN
mgnify:CR=1 FL=1